MEKRRFESVEVFSCLKTSTLGYCRFLKDHFLRNRKNTELTHCPFARRRILLNTVRDSEPIRLLQSPRSLSVYILNCDTVPRNRPLFMENVYSFLETIFFRMYWMNIK